MNFGGFGNPRQGAGGPTTESRGWRIRSGGA